MSIHLSPPMYSSAYALSNQPRRIVTNSRLSGVQKKVSKLSKSPDQLELISAIQTIEKLMQKHKAERQGYKAERQEYRAERQEYRAEMQKHKAEMQKLMDDHKQFLRDFRPPLRKVKESLNTNAHLDQQAVVKKETDNISSFTNSISQENIAKPSWWETALKIIQTLMNSLFSFVKIK
ncbi:hypothetical protein [Candidatus Protochlamydia amoebophila]|uniref:hypothetical protein n=1 Tax=Candidatus Protochlamydia amoebophila TaxID=362787 RepID=UPI001BC9B39E|nr:hypothetical protein [Candidatus Protochlamydia amoebophila]